MDSRSTSLVLNGRVLNSLFVFLNFKIHSSNDSGTEEDAVYIINELAKRTLKGSDHVPGARYSFHRNGKIKGLTALKQLMEELRND